MNIQKEMKWFLSHYGVDVMVEGKFFRAVLLPSFKNTLGRRQEGDYIPAGKSPQEEYIYLGDPACSLPEDTFLVCKGRTLVTRSSMMVYFENKPLYIRAILTPMEVV